MSKFKKGDRVRALGYEDSKVWGGVGTVTADNSVGGIYLVDFDGAEGGFWPHQLAPTTLRIEAGKCYRTRDGRKAVIDDWDGEHWEGYVDELYRCFDSDGTHAFRISDLDLIAEWVDEPQEGEPVTAATQPKFKVGDRVRLMEDHEYIELVDGDVGTLMEDDDGAPFVHWDRTDTAWAVSNRALTPYVAALQIAAGKFYKTRDGRKVGPMVKWWTKYEVEHPWEDHLGHLYRPDGTSEHNEDLIAEWTDANEPVVSERVAEQQEVSRPTAPITFEGGVFKVNAAALKFEDFAFPTPPATPTTGFTVPLCAFDDDTVTTTALGDAYVAGYKAGLAAHLQA